MPRRPHAPPRTRPATAPAALVLKITLCGLRPRVCRRVRVPGDITLRRLHLVIQAAMGYHLHEFEFGDRRYGEPDDDPWPGDAPTYNESSVRLGALIDRGTQRFRYLYDFGDGWDHEIAVEKAEPLDPEQQYPSLIEGKRACPPEDCGGVYGYLRLLEVLADPSDEEQGGFAEAVLRIMLAVARAERMVDARGLRLAQRIKQEHPVLSKISREQVRAAAKEEAFMLCFDEERALAALPYLLPGNAERREAVEIVRKIGFADGVITSESEAVLGKIERILSLDQTPAVPPAGGVPAGKARTRKKGAAKADSPCCVPEIHAQSLWTFARIDSAVAVQAKGRL